MINASPKHAKDEAGFTLIEIMLALLVITIGVVSSIGLLGNALDSSKKAHDDLNIISFADLVLNYCQSLDNFNDLPSTGTLQIPDYSQRMTSLKIGDVARFTCMVPGFAGTPKETYVVSYKFNILTDGKVKALSLKVWPGYDINRPPRVFYTEIYNWRMN